jgi:peptidoglycan/xylan/chitin deacetylase (PgdA/CDA1 family)
LRVVSPLLKHIVYPGLSRSGYLRRLATSAPAVVTYHGILPRGYEIIDSALDGHLVTAHSFVQQLDLLKKNYNVISPQEFLSWCDGEVELPRRSVLLTCDDGLRNILTDMLPIIADAQVPFLFFVTGASVDAASSMLWYEKVFLWMKAAAPERLSRLSEPQYAGSDLRAVWVALLKQLSALEWHARKEAIEELRIRLGISNNWQAEYSENEALCRRFFMLNRTEVNELMQAGMTIGAHTMSHPMLSHMIQDHAFNEIERSRSVLESTLGGIVWAFAYPFGTREAVNSREEQLARDAGFKCAFMNIEDSYTENKFGFPRIHVSLNMSVAELDAHVSGFHAAIHKVASAAMPA